MSDLGVRLERAASTAASLRDAIGKVLVGQTAVVDEVLFALVAGGHVLLEGAPGVGKTLLVRTLSECLDLRFSRIQFTPALMPSDVLGANVLVLDASGRPMAVAVPGADVRDWEDLAAGPCPGFAEATAGEGCLYIADIGDNQESRERITIYQVPVPPPGSTSTKVTSTIHLRYPDRAHDAEALVITTSGTFIITKDIPARVYRFVAAANPGQAATLTLSRTLTEEARITGAAVSPDERWVALRSNRMLFLYTLDHFVNGGEPNRIDLRSFNEPQGEGVTFGSDADLYLVSEGGGKNAAGVLTRIRCAFLR